MRTIALAFLFFTTALSAACAHKIVRHGYQPAVGAPSDCSAAIVENRSIETYAGAVRRGSLDVKDTGVSINCDKAAAYAIFKREACAADANVVNVVSQKGRDWVSSCFRGTAELWHVTSNALDRLGGASPLDPAPLENIRIRK